MVSIGLGEITLAGEGLSAFCLSLWKMIGLFTARASHENEISSPAGLTRRIVKPLALLFVTINRILSASNAFSSSSCLCCCSSAVSLGVGVMELSVMLALTIGVWS